jgi:CheY-like chemotaxis protein
MQEAEKARVLVLIVDDHPVNRMVMLKQLNALGYAAETAESAREALEKLKSGRFGALFTDCTMPDMSGYDLARVIRALEAAAGKGHIPIIACTANALPGEVEKCIEAGMDDYLAKPVDLAAVALKLERWVHPSPIDAELLAQITGGDPNTALDILKQFLRYNVRDTANLREAFRDRAEAELIIASHRIKGAAGAVGAAHLAEACEEVERNARTGDWSAVASALRAFDREVDRLVAYIDARTSP